jgi:cytochrome c biogenesis protein CcmG, thiol:disulfide interchange protein DsbE
VSARDASVADARAADAAQTTRRSLGADVALAVVAVGVVALLGAFALQLRRPTTGPVIGRTAPDFTLATFDGDRVSLSALRGQVVVLNFWASWCITCANEAADLEAIARDYRDRGVTVLGVGYTDTRAAALAYLDRHGVTYPNAPDRGGVVSQRYRLDGVPETVVIDRSGRVVALPLRGQAVAVAKLQAPIVPGGAFTPDDLRALLDRLTTGGNG